MTAPYSASLRAAYDVAALRTEQFPITRDTVYLNHAGISPLPRRTHDVVNEANDRMMLDPSGAFPMFIERMHLLQAELRDLINAASADEIVGVQSTSLAINLAAHSFPWRRGENIVLCNVEFPSNVYPWMRAAELHGLETRLIPAQNGGLRLDALAAAVDSQTRLVAVSALQFLSGHRTDLQAVGAFCHERGITLSVDAIQSIAHIPIDVQTMHIGILAAGGQKSLMGPVGTGFLYVRGDLVEQMRPAMLGANGVVDFLRWLEYKLTPAHGAARFNMGTFNLPGMLGLLESVQLLRGLGIAHIDSYTTALARYAIERLRAEGYEVITPDDHGPIVTFRAAPTDETTTKLVAALNAQRIFTAKHWDAQRTAYVRASFHCYNTLEDVDRLLAALKELPI